MLLLLPAEERPHHVWLFEYYADPGGGGVPGDVHSRHAGARRQDRVPAGHRRPRRSRHRVHHDRGLHRRFAYETRAADAHIPVLRGGVLRDRVRVQHRVPQRGDRQRALRHTLPAHATNLPGDPHKELNSENGTRRDSEVRTGQRPCVDHDYH